MKVVFPMKKMSITNDLWIVLLGSVLEKYSFDTLFLLILVIYLMEKTSCTKGRKRKCNSKKRKLKK